MQRRAWSVLGPCVVAAGVLSHVTMATTLAAQSRSSGLRIVVIEGEDAVNVVQQKTAVAPVVEVRDRNDQPVGGAVVSFAVRHGRATFSGARGLTVTTNAAGRAVATGLTPTGSGALQISASAAFQGQTAAITIAQTNVMTAAQVAATAGASGAGSGGAGAGAGAGGAAGGGGMSATTIGVIAGAAAAGTVVAARTLGGEDGQGYTGRFSGSESLSFGGVFCRTEILTGTLKMRIRVGNGNVSGTANIDDGAITTPTVSAGCSGFLNHTDSFGLQDAAVSGSTSNMTFFKPETNNVPPNSFDPQGTTNTHEYTFTGSLNGSTLTGTIAHRRIVGGAVAGTANFQVTLQ